MDKTERFIASVIKHAEAPRIYDPQKAHDYYMRTRELKGRRPALKSKHKKKVLNT